MVVELCTRNSKGENAEREEGFSIECEGLAPPPQAECHEGYADHEPHGLLPPEPRVAAHPEGVGEDRDERQEDTEHENEKRRSPLCHGCSFPCLFAALR